MTDKPEGGTTARRRRICGYCETVHDLDGLGPIAPGDVTTVGMCRDAARRVRLGLDEAVPKDLDVPEEVERANLEEFLETPFQQPPALDGVAPAARGGTDRLFGLLFFVAVLTLAIAAFTAGLQVGRG